MRDAPWSPVAFEERYATSADPWSFASSTYELDRYSAVLAALRRPPHHYRLGYEPACSIGVLTERLAERCDSLVASDVSPTAVAAARERCGDRPGLTIEVDAVQDGARTIDAPDLVVFSELGYYFERSELRAIVRDLVRSSAGGADVVACHWTGESPDHQLSGAVVHDVLTEVLAPVADLVRSDVHHGFLIAAWRIHG